MGDNTRPQGHDEDWMREACIVGTRLEFAARKAAAEALTPDMGEKDHAKICTALADLEDARKHYEEAADRHSHEAIRLASVSDAKEEFSGPAVTLKQIETAVCRKHGITPEQLKGPRRNYEFVWARQEFFYLARTLTQRSYPEIGRWCGGRDHTTVIHGEKRHRQRVGVL